MKITKKILAVLLVFAMIFGVIATANAASSYDPLYLENPRFIDKTPDEINAMQANGEKFIVMAYLPGCGNCAIIGNGVVSRWMDVYGVNIYGVNLDEYSVPKFVIDAYGYVTYKTPLIGFIDGSRVIAYKGRYSGMENDLNADFYDFYGLDAPVRVQGVSVIPEDVTLTVGESKKLSAVISPENATDKRLTWITWDDSVVTVSEDGTITAVGTGMAWVVAKAVDNGLEGWCTVTVKSAQPDEPVTPTYKNATSVDIVVNRDFDETNTASLSAKINPSDAEYSRIDWLSSDISVANVNSYGLVTLNGSEGTAQIIVRVTNKDGSTVSDSITVRYEAPDDDEGNADIGEGDESGEEDNGNSSAGIFSTLLNLFSSFLGFFISFFNLILALIPA